MLHFFKKCVLLKWYIYQLISNFDVTVPLFRIKSLSELFFLKRFRRTHFNVAPSEEEMATVRRCTICSGQPVMSPRS